MFDPENARQEFEKFLRGKGLHQRDLTLADGCEAVFDFYRDLRPRGRVFKQRKDADMLLFQWGTYDWGTGEHFSFNLTRQLIGEGPVDDAMRQLGLTFEFQPDNELRAFAQWQQMVRLPAGVARISGIRVSIPRIYDLYRASNPAGRH
jgi:hypothetical protein